MATSLANKPKVPKYQTLTQQLRRQVEEGVLRPGDRLPSFAEMREQYGISQATIERIYTLLEQDGLVVREQGRGTFVAAVAQRQSTGIIGVTGVDRGEWQNSLFWAHLLDGIIETAAAHNLQTLLIDADSNFTQWEKIDGVIVGGMDKSIIASRLQIGMPCVPLLIALPGVTSIVADDYGGTYAAMEHLIALGHRRIAYLGAGNDVFSRTRISAYHDAMQAANLEADPRWVRRVRHPFAETEPFVHQGRDRIREWLDEDWRELGCTALLTLNDHIAVGAIETFGAAGIKVPEQLSIVGFDGTELYDYFTPRLTTIEVPLKKIGASAAEVLIRQIEGEAIAAATIALNTPLRIGKSTAPPPQ